MSNSERTKVKGKNLRKRIVFFEMTTTPVWLLMTECVEEMPFERGLKRKYQ